MTESELLAETLRLCEKNNVLAFHDYTPRRNVPGFPDLVLVGLYHHMFAELKAYPSAPFSPAQVTWKNYLRASAARYVVWVPADFHSGEIERVLASLSKP